VASVNLLSGWSEDSATTSNVLVLDGPQSISVGIETQQIATSLTLSAVFSKVISNFQNNSNDINVSTCQQPQTATLPGSPALNGGVAQVCFTAQTQSGSLPIVALIFEALVPLSGSSSQQVLASETTFIPQSDGTNAFEQVVVPELQTINWLQMSSSS
jgi:hypothetical protein